MAKKKVVTPLTHKEKENQRQLEVITKSFLEREKKKKAIGPRPRKKTRKDAKPRS